MVTTRDVECMSLALRLAKRGQYTTRPNPNVGCVITDSNDNIVGSGYHQKAGCDHAEVIALREAGEQAKNGTAYVSLEPCCHQGKTGPCTLEIIKSGIRRVVIAAKDPNPLVAGKGIALLRENGITVDEDVLHEQSIALNRGFIKRMKDGYPWVTVKSASSLDGKTSLKNGTSKWITSEHARHDVQKLRAAHDAIMTGIGTVASDNPSLNVRLSASELTNIEEIMQPTRVVIDHDLKIPTDAKLLSLDGKIIIYTGSHTNDQAFSTFAQVEIVKLESDNRKLNFRSVLKDMAQREINSVLVEAGPTLLGELVQAKLVDEWVSYIAPTLMGNDAKSMVNTAEITEMENCISLQCTDFRKIGDNFRITSLVKY